MSDSLGSQRQRSNGPPPRLEQPAASPSHLRDLCDTQDPELPGLDDTDTTTANAEIAADPADTNATTEIPPDPAVSSASTTTPSTVETTPSYVSAAPPVPTPIGHRRLPSVNVRSKPVAQHGVPLKPNMGDIAEECTASGHVGAKLLALENCYPTFKQFETYHKRWSEQPLRDPRPTPTKIAKSNSFTSKLHKQNGNEREVSEWYQKFIKSVKNLSDDDIDLNVFVDHFRDVSNLEAHPLFLVLKGSLQESKLGMMAVSDIGSSIAVDRLVEAAEVCATKMSNEAVKVYKPLKHLRSVLDRSMVELIFQENYLLLWTNYCQTFECQDVSLREKASQFLTISPAHMGLKQQFWLTETHQRGAVEMLADTKPYGVAIETAKNLNAARTPWAKIQVLIDVGKAISSCVCLFWGKEVYNKMRMTADEFLPLFAFVILKANLQHPFTECKFIEHFLGDEDLEGEPGYIFVTYQTALSLILRMQPDQVINLASLDFAAKKAAPTSTTTTTTPPVTAPSTTPPSTPTKESRSGSSLATSVLSLVTAMTSRHPSSSTHTADTPQSPKPPNTPSSSSH
ncbi:hypothetical protein Pelo_12973 [Pelomyxa schiedti]|nr:hypothetical protein Pelo_12973 [Pelomyxa schiedti]